MGYIYGLADPSDHVVRYVGKTSRSVALRLSEHVRRSTDVNRRGKRTRLNRWVLSLGCAPEMVILEDGPLLLDSAERRWIRQLRDNHLVNMTVGGDGGRPQRRRDDDA